MHTRSDVLTSAAVLGALLGVWWGFPLFDPLAALLVAAFIGHAGWEIAKDASRVLSDEIVIGEEDVRAVVHSVPEVLGCEKIRTRGSADHAFMDLHVWLDRQTPLQDAHATSHVVKDKLMSRFPQLVDVVIHIEPPPLADGTTGSGIAGSGIRTLSSTRSASTNLGSRVPDPGPGSPIPDPDFPVLPRHPDCSRPDHGANRSRSWRLHRRAGARHPDGYSHVDP